MREITYLSSARGNFNKQLKELIAFDVTFSRKVERTVETICRDVRKNGDAAVLKYTKRFDRVDRKRVAALELSQKVLHSALARLDHTQRRALEQAAARVRKYHRQQRAETQKSFVEADGTTLGLRVNALDRVGLYVPGGEAAYPSSVLMNAIPAKIAGVRELVMTVPTPGGVRNPLVLAAAAVAGVDRVFTIGGAQAIAALAYGTKTIKQVDKIVGPGNAYVTAAKRRVFGTVGIDMISGPTEIVVICDGTTDADWITMDLFSQAEHHVTAQAILISPSEAFIERVRRSIERQLPSMSRRKIIEKSLRRRGALIKVRNLNEACDIANRIAPEHLELSVADPKRWLKKIRHAGAIFLGRYSSEALGDYCAGPNHVLPTSRTARFSSPLGVYDFQKRSSIIDVSRKGAQKLGKIAATLARGEGFQAHARSAELRLQEKSKAGR
jgi:histidinol dehydrogenase